MAGYRSAADAQVSASQNEARIAYAEAWKDARESVAREYAYGLTRVDHEKAADKLRAWGYHGLADKLMDELGQ